MGPQSKSKSMQPCGSTKQTSVNWVELPPDITSNILHRIGAIDILENAQKVCSSWRKICQDPCMWRIIDIQNTEAPGDLPYDLEKMCKHAVDRSQGQLQDINIVDFGNPDMLHYIVDGSSQLRRIQISCCYGSYYEGLSEAVKKMPLLEELSLTLTGISKEAIESAGRFCTRLNSFKLNTNWHKFPDIVNPTSVSNEFTWDRDDEALAIAKNMPHLRNLQLIGNQMTNNGLQAILDGCPHLESLDLRWCFNLNLEGSLGKRCTEQIKVLWHPNDSAKGCEFAFIDDDHDYDDIDDYDINSLLAYLEFE